MKRWHMDSLYVETCTIHVPGQLLFWNILSLKCHIATALEVCSCTTCHNPSKTRNPCAFALITPIPYYRLVARATHPPSLPSFVTAHSTPQGSMRYQNSPEKRQFPDRWSQSIFEIEFLIKFHAGWTLSEEFTVFPCCMACVSPAVSPKPGYRLICTLS